MPRQSLLEYFQPQSRPPREIAVAWRRGYRTVRWTYAELLQTAHQFAKDLASRGVTKSDRAISRPAANSKNFSAISKRPKANISSAAGGVSAPFTVASVKALDC